MRAGTTSCGKSARPSRTRWPGEFSHQIEELTGRKVLTYQSQLTYDPHTRFEIFVLDPRVDGTPEAEATGAAQQRRAAPVG